jgi:hypothetical protein
MIQSSLSLREVFWSGWQLMRARFGLLFLLFVVFWVVQLTPNVVFLLNLNGYTSFPDIVVNVSGWIAFAIGLIIDVSLVAVALKLHDGERVRFADVFAFSRRVFAFFVASAAYFAPVWLPLEVERFLFLYPNTLAEYGTFVVTAFWGMVAVLWFLAFLLWPRWQFYPYLIVEKHLSPVESFRASGAMSQEHRSWLTLFLLVLSGVNILGVMFLGVWGLVWLLVSMPVSLMTHVSVYRRLANRDTDVGFAKPNSSELAAA